MFAAMSEWLCLPVAHLGHEHEAVPIVNAFVEVPTVGTAMRVSNAINAVLFNQMTDTSLRRPLARPLWKSASRRLPSAAPTSCSGR